MYHPVLVDIDNVSKCFCRSLKRSLWYGIQDVGKELIGRSQETKGLRKGEFWAIRNVTFQVHRKETVGLIGHNGAGKTTLLKLIHGLIKPNGGRITIRGSMRALIALGTGFNPVLSGRENIWIAGAVLGYSEREIRERFDEIVDFSELGDYIDFPVQTYSSGMLARLGFSVAIHTQPDILLVDEVLAVGDLNFAIRCYRKISEFREAGGSIILVTHNPYAIRTNCDRAIWIENGVVQKIGRAEDVSTEYELATARKDTRTGGRRYLEGTVEIEDLTYPTILKSGDEFTIKIKLRATRMVESPILVIGISNINEHNLLNNVSTGDGFVLKIPEGQSIVSVRYPSLPLVRGVYYINLVLSEKYMNNQLAVLINCYKFEIQTDVNDIGTGMFKLQPHWEI